MADVLTIARRNMIKGQLMPVGVRDERLLHAFEVVPRDRFAPSHAPSLAYADMSLSTDGSEQMLAPQAVGRLLEEVKLEPHEKVLYLGGGGYGAALSGYLAREVIGVLATDTCVRTARKVLEDLEIFNVVLVAAPWQDGMPAFAPYDVILVEGALSSLPDSWVGQLPEEGRVAWYHYQGAGRPAVATLSVYCRGQPSVLTPFEASVPRLAGDLDLKRGFQL
ncbi:MAG: protein-L-isoaspartate O-methyltransferase family protein [Holosporales bacterium]